jgi:hypothetical protein
VVLPELRLLVLVVFANKVHLYALVAVLLNVPAVTPLLNALTIMLPQIAAN